MSGPKVVRIVTREEVVALCQQHLARLDAAVAAWIVTGLRNDIVSEKDVAAAETRRDQLRKMLAAEAFLELQKSVPEEIAFLEADIQRRLAAAIARAAEERTRQRRRAGAAKALLAELKATGAEVPAALSQSLEALSSNRGDEQKGDRAFAGAFELLHRRKAPSTEAASGQTREIAGRLGNGSRSESLADWKKRRLEGDEDNRLQRIDRLIAELIAVDEDAARTFERRLAALHGEAVDARSALLADSLVADLAEATRKAREKHRLLAKLREQLAEIKGISSAQARALIADLEAAIAASDISRAHSLLAAAAAETTAEIGRVAAEARRQAILQGLSSLGYEVREGMATAFAKGEAVVMRHSNTPGFGLEVSGPPETQRLQMRVVAFGSPGAPRDSSRDRDIELQWCGDFSKLQSALGEIGSEIAIERSLAVGAVPLRVVSDETGVKVDEAQRIYRHHTRARDVPKN